MKGKYFESLMFEIIVILLPTGLIACLGVQFKRKKNISTQDFESFSDFFKGKIFLKYTTKEQMVCRFVQNCEGCNLLSKICEILSEKNSDIKKPCKLY